MDGYNCGDYSKYNMKVHHQGWKVAAYLHVQENVVLQPLFYKEMKNDKIGELIDTVTYDILRAKLKKDILKEEE